MNKICRRGAMTSLVVAAAASCGVEPLDPPIEVTVTDSATGGFGGPDVGPPDPTGDNGAGSPMTFYIAETVHFLGVPEGCDNDDVNDVTSELRDWMVADGWSGVRLLNGQSTPYDFIDGNRVPGGRDWEHADSARVTVYASHGNINRQQWGRPGQTPPGFPDLCGVNIRDEFGLGRLGGNASAAVIHATSCTGSTANDNLPINLGGASEIGQHFGWHNSPALDRYVLARFFVDTGPSDFEPNDSVDAIAISNRESFLSNGQARPGLAKNSPVVFTTGRTVTEVTERHYGARMAEGVGLDEVIPEPQSPDIYNYGWVDNGGFTCL